MAVKLYKPTTPARRYLSVADYSSLTKKRPEKSLTRPLKTKAGRNNSGKITVRHRGGGAKRQYRVIDFMRKNFDAPAEVKAIEYDPNRTCFIMLLEYKDGTKSYALAPHGIKVGATVVSTQEPAEPKLGNRMPLSLIPEGSTVFNIELNPLGGGKVVRSAGSGATIMVKDGGKVQLKLPSGEIRIFQERCLATIGQLSNPDHGNTVIGKAGRVRHLKRRPTVRGKAMNPVDHPHGGGEGRAPIGLKAPKTKWGKIAIGKKTRKKRKHSDKVIVRRRKSKRR